MAARNVLWVGDDQALLTRCQQGLQASGLSVLTASSGKDALTTLTSQLVDAVVVDDSMPSADWENVALTLKQSKPRVPVILLSREAPAANHGAMVDVAIQRPHEDLSQLLSRLDSLIKLRSHSHPELDQEYVVFADASRCYLDCSDGVCQLLGYTRTELLGMTIEDVSYSADEVSVLFEKFIRSGQQDGDYVLRNKAGMPVPIRYRAHVFEDGCIAAVWDPAASWKQLYALALVEANPAKLRERVEAAHAAIEARMAELTKQNDRTSEEWPALQDALSGLRVLSREVDRPDKN